MRFKVPQFLDIEDKIFGPFTFKEFVYLAGGAGLGFTLYKLLGLVFGAIPILIVVAFALALTFYRPNDKPFVNIVEAGFKYFTQSKLYIWKRKMNKKSPVASLKEGESDQKMGEVGARLGGSKLRDLAWSLDVLDLSKQKNTQ